MPTPTFNPLPQWLGDDVLHHEPGIASVRFGFLLRAKHWQPSRLIGEMPSLPNAVTVAAHEIQVQAFASSEAARNHPETAVAGWIAQEVSGVDAGHEDRAPLLFRQSLAVELAIAANLVGDQCFEIPRRLTGGEGLQLGYLNEPARLVAVLLG